MSDWKPIETAPRDGRIIYIKHENGEIVEAFWKIRQGHNGVYYGEWETISLIAHGHWHDWPENPEIAWRPKPSRLALALCRHLRRIIWRLGGEV